MTTKFPSLFFGILFCTIAMAQTKTERFDRDPQWDGLNNRQTLAKYPTVVQDFGYSKTNHAGAAGGEIGGQVWRTSTPAWYGMKLDKPLSLQQEIHFSANFSVPLAQGGGVKLGFFNPDNIRIGGRPMNSFRMELDGGKTIVRVFVRMNGAQNSAAGTLVPYAKKVKQAFGHAADGTKHRITIDYDPAGGEGRGKVRAKVDELEPAEFVLPEGFKDQPFNMTHFGMMPNQKSGSKMMVYFDDVTINGRELAFNEDPKWEEHGSRATFEDHEIANLQSYGFSNTSLAGSKPGEIGGIFWNATSQPSYYADRVGPFTLNDKVQASGTVCLRVGAPDSGALIGFFDSDSMKAGKIANIVAIQINGPSRVGHWFRPLVAGMDEKKFATKEGPVLPADEKPHQWSMVYQPAKDGRGTLTVTLDGKSVDMKLPANIERNNVHLDRFGVFTPISGGDQVKLYFDDLTYTATSDQK